MSWPSAACFRWVPYVLVSSACAAELDDPEGRFEEVDVAELGLNPGRAEYLRPSAVPSDPDASADDRRDAATGEDAQPGGPEDMDASTSGSAGSASSTPGPGGDGAAGRASTVCPAARPDSCAESPADILLSHCSGLACHGTPEHAPLFELDLVFETEGLESRLMNAQGTKECAAFVLFDAELPLASLMVRKLKYPSRAAVPCGQGMPPPGFDRYFTAADAACIASWLQAETDCL